MYFFNPIAVSAAAEQTAEDLRTQGDSSAALVRVQGGNLTVAVATGVADIETATPAAPDMRYEIGSQTKMMTATIILQLRGEGRIDLDAPIIDYLNADTLAGIANAGTATVRQLLQMTSGIENYTDVRGEDGIPLFISRLLADPQGGVGVPEALDVVRGLPGVSAPGEFHYSNTNYALLGLIIEGLTDEPLTQTFQTRIFDPAGMTVAELAGKDRAGDGLHGYLLASDGVLNDVTFARIDYGAEGGVIANTADMSAFLRALLIDGTLLDPAGLAQMRDMIETETGPGARALFGLGLSGLEIDGLGLFEGFTGQTLGHLSSTYREVGGDLVVSVEVNQGESTANTDFATINLLDSLGDDPAWAAITGFDARRDMVRVTDASAAEARIDGAAMTIGAATLTLPIDLAQVTDRNIRFDDGSVLIVGDNRVGKAGDDRGNLINLGRLAPGAVDQDNQVLGLGGDDVIRAARGDDRLSGGAGRDHLWGAGGADRIDGGAGDDWLSGDLGADLLTGGQGADVFNFDTVREIGRLRGVRDVIQDWESGDIIDLAGIDARVDQAGDQAFHMVDAFTGQAGELKVSGLARLGVSYVEGDVTGDGRADFRIELAGVHALDAFDFVL